MWLIGILVSWTGIEPVPPAVDVWRPNYWCENAQSLSHVWLFCNPMDCSPSDSSVHGILQARILEWAVISSFRGSSQPRDWTRVFYVSCIGRQILYYWATWEAPNHWIAREFPACTLIICTYNIIYGTCFSTCAVSFSNFCLVTKRNHSKVRLTLNKKILIFSRNCFFRSDQISRSVVSHSLQPHESQHARPPCPSPAPGVHSDSRPSSQWCHPVISSSVVPFFSCPQSQLSSESFPMSQLFAWGGQSTGVSVLASFLPRKSHG